jgi:predicted metal-dependent TIM-barrel fold hydrolase
MYGNERIWMNSAGDWGCSDPLAVPKARIEMLRRGHSEAMIDKVTLDNPIEFLSQSPNFKV